MKPDDKVYARLFASPIHGVGVVAICDIPKGTDIFNEANDYEEFLELPESDVRGMPPSAIKKLYEDFCVFRDGVVYCPQSFNKMTVGYYVNHSKAPNCVAETDGIYFIAARDIVAGEELTVDYSSYSEEV